MAFCSLKRALCQHIGIAFDSILVISDRPAITTLFSKSQGTIEAVANRPEYQMLNKATEAEELQMKMTRGELMPQLALGAIAAYVDLSQFGNYSKTLLSPALVFLLVSGGVVRIKLSNSRSR